MRVPDPLLMKKISRYLATFFLGVITGGIVIFYMYGHLMDEILLENKQLHLTNKKLEEEYEQLEKDRDELSQQNREILIKKIEIQIVKEDDYDIDGFTEAEVLDRLRRDMRFLLQLPIESVAETSEIIRQLVNGRKYEIQQQQIGIKLETLVLHSTTMLKISLHKIS
jgi:cell division protein FtsL